jgi:hypothetical protein
MAYQVNRYNGTFLVSVNDGTIDSTTDLRFLGKNYAGYGQVQNENFLHLLEHFAGSSQPTKPISGQLWFDTTDRKIKIYDGIRFRPVGGSSAGSAAPTGLAAGEFWFDTISQQLYCWSGSEFILIGPENPVGLGETSIQTKTIRAIGGATKSVALFLSAGSIIGILSSYSDFEIDTEIPGNSIPGFSKIRKGLNLVDLLETVDGDTLSLPASSTNFWGTASASKGLADSSGNFYSVEDFVRKAVPEFDSTVSMKEGLTVGRTANFKIGIASSTDVELINQTGNNILFKIRVSGNDTTIAELSKEAILPGLTSTYNLGSENNRWSRLYTDFVSASNNIVTSGSFIGNVLGNVRGNVLSSTGATIIDSNTRNITAATIQGNFDGDLNGTATLSLNSLRVGGFEAKIESTSSTVAVRDVSGNLTANNFIGTADRADRIKIDNSAEDIDLFYRSAKTIKAPSSIAARDPAGNLSANIFNGTATAVEGADLAEKYLADQTYTVGTVVSIGGDAEIRSSVLGDRAIGVISDNPGLIMNQDLANGSTVALKGRVPVRVIGSIHKGDRLVATENGCAMHAGFHQYTDVFAIALETNLNTTEKLVESIIL